MMRYMAPVFCSVLLLAGWSATEAKAQAAQVQTHLAAAEAAASEPGLFDLTSTFELICRERPPRPPLAPGEVQPDRIATRNRNRQIPERSEWYVEPAKVFDNLYSVGTSFYVWALTTSDGIILLNAGLEYTAEAVPEGLQKMGLNPADVKYVVIHSGHDMQYGAAKLFQDRYQSRIMVSEADWDLIEKTTLYPDSLKPTRDMVVRDGQTLTLGDTTLTFHLTPGNTAGTLSTIVPLKDGNQRHVGILMGGRDINFSEGGVSFFSDDMDARRAWKTSANRLQDIVSKAGVDVFLTIRSLYDQELEKARVLKLRQPGDPHPYVSENVVSRYLTTISECMDAQLARAAAN